MTDAPDAPFNELAQYFVTSPNSLVAGCMNTHEETDGVVFPGIEPQEDSFCFVGRESIVAAVGVLYDLSPDEVDDRLCEDAQADADYVKALEKEIKELKTFKLKLEKMFA